MTFSLDESSAVAGATHVVQIYHGEAALVQFNERIKLLEAAASHAVTDDVSGVARTGASTSDLRSV